MFFNKLKAHPTLGKFKRSFIGGFVCATTLFASLTAGGQIESSPASLAILIMLSLILTLMMVRLITARASRKSSSPKYYADFLMEQDQ